MMLPTIHRNGTHPRDLLEGLMQANAALQDAIRAVAASGPNGRDYYPQSPGAIHAAIAEHESRLQRLQAVRDELNTIAEHVADHV